MCYILLENYESPFRQMHTAQFSRISLESAGYGGGKWKLPKVYSTLTFFSIHPNSSMVFDTSWSIKKRRERSLSDLQAYTIANSNPTSLAINGAFIRHNILLEIKTVSAHPNQACRSRWGPITKLTLRAEKCILKS